MSNFPDVTTFLSLSLVCGVLFYILGNRPKGKVEMCGDQEYLHLQIEDLLGYHFSNDDLSPETRKKINSFVGDTQVLKDLDYKSRTATRFIRFVYKPELEYLERRAYLREKIQPIVNDIHRELAEMHKLRLRPETVEYKIVTDFSLKEGGFLVKCPNCGAAIDLIKSKIDGNKYRCQFCSNFVIVPEKILRLL